SPRDEELDELRRSRRERAGILEEEWPLLWKKQREASEVRPLLVDLDLREVGVVREIEREARRHAELGVGAELARPLRTAINGEVAMRTAEHVWGDRRKPASRNANVLQRSGARQPVEIELSGD